MPLTPNTPASTPGPRNELDVIDQGLRRQALIPARWRDQRFIDALLDRRLTLRAQQVPA